jgi:hypothetical protein
MPLDPRVGLTTIASTAAELLTGFPAPPAPVVSVAAGASLQAALDTAPLGARVVLENNATWTGNYFIRRPLSLVGAGLGSQLRPAATSVPTLQVLANDVAVADLQLHNGDVDKDCVIVGSFEATTDAEQPHHVLLSRVRVQAGPQGGHRGIVLHGSDLVVEECEVRNFWEVGRDSQAIWIHNGSGPYRVKHCFLEASGEVILLGGASAKIPNCVPADVEITDNNLVVSLAPGAQVKCGFEIKNGRRVSFRRNAIFNWRPGLQQGAIQLTPRNQNGDNPWAILEDIEIAYTTFRNVGGGFAVNILGVDNESLAGSQQSRRFHIHHNLFTGSASFLQVLGAVTESLIVEHNTAPLVSNRLLSFDRTGQPAGLLTPLTFAANVVRTGEYGISGRDLIVGLPSLLAYCTIERWADNIIEQNAPADRPMAWPSGQSTVPAGGLVPLLDPITFKVLQGTSGY